MKSNKMKRSTVIGIFLVGIVFIGAIFAAGFLEGDIGKFFPSISVGSESGSEDVTASNGGGDPTVNLTASQDTYIDEDHETINYGNNAELKCKNETGKSERSLIQFDLSGIPQCAVVTNATLGIYVTAVKTKTINIHRLTHNWTEMGATWNAYDGTNSWSTSGGDYDSTVNGSFSGATTGYKEVNLTSLVQGWLNGTWANYGILLEGVTQDEVKFSSREGDHPPYLNISYLRTDADLGITKMGSPSPVVAGQYLNYTINVTNDGPCDAVNVTVNDILPTHVTFNSSNPSPSGNDGQLYWWNFSKITADSYELITINATVDIDTTSSSLINTVNVTSDTCEIITANNTATEQTSVLYGADLGIIKADNPDPVVVGGYLNYTLNVTNKGPFDAVNVNVTDTLPAGVQFNSANPDPSGGSYPTYWWNLGTISAGSYTLITINVTVDSGATGPLCNTANVTSETSDQFPGNNTDTEHTIVDTGANLSIEKVDLRDPVQNGSLLNYTIWVNNTGTGVATNVIVIDTYDANVTFVSADPTPTTGDNIWNFSIINVGESKRINVTVNTSSTLDINATLFNFVNVTCDQNISDNATEYTMIDAPTNLRACQEIS